MDGSNEKNSLPIGRAPLSPQDPTTYALHELKSAFRIHAPDKSRGKRRQAIDIEYDYAGFIPLEKLMRRMNQETA